MNLQPEEITQAHHFISAYAMYVKCRALKIPIRAVDIDPLTLDILYTFHRKIEEIEDAKKPRKA